jgi:hypothetical protein
MLYNLCSDFTLESLISWLETLEATKPYLYLNPSGCVLAEFFKSCGFTDVAVDRWQVWFAGDTYALPLEWGRIASTEPYTYGAALQRVKEVRQNLHSGSGETNTISS